jgi:hypothetical protein
MGAPLDPEQKRAQSRIDDLEQIQAQERPKLQQLRQQRTVYVMTAHPDPRKVAGMDREIGKAQRAIDDRDNDIRNLKLRHGLR